MLAATISDWVLMYFAQSCSLQWNCDKYSIVTPTKEFKETTRYIFFSLKVEETFWNVQL